MTIDDFTPQEVAWCDTCRAHVDGECDHCHSPFEVTDQRYRSQSFHYHPYAIGGVSGTVAIHKTLCVDCYRIDYEAVFKIPAPTLPDRGMDPRFFAQQQIANARRQALSLIEVAKSRPLTADEAAHLAALIPQAIK